MAVTPSSALFAKCQEQIRPVNAAAQRVASAPPQPDDWHAVRHYQIRRVQNLLELWIVLSLDNTVHACGGDGVVSLFLADPILHSGDDVRDLDRVHADSQNSEAGVLLKGLRRLSLRRHS